MAVNIKPSPKACGLPELVIPQKVTKQSIYKDKRIWILNVANFPVYVLRFMVIDWGVLMLKEYNGFSITHGALAIIGFELAGVVGILLSGVITDKFLKHSSQRACAIGMGGATLSLLMFMALKYTHPFIYISALVLCGFFIYIPQAAGGIAVAKIGTQSDAGKAVGLHGLFGYIPTAFTSTIIAFITQSYGWNASLICVVLTGFVGTILFASLWNTKSDGY
ncbi:hypothetical protein AGMMS49592_0560 [Endomicrobiia bacterium]|nr:hypothetical protein AGMMS49592_0560 [Endomicrobiia bacterium]